MSEKAKQNQTKILIPQQGHSTPAQKIEANKELDDYLDSEFNLEIYEDLTEGDWKNTFDEPLDFFHLLYEKVEFVVNNKTKPTMVIKTLKQLPLNDHQFYYLFHYLTELLGDEFGDELADNQRIEICSNLIEKEYKKLGEKLFPKTIEEAEVLTSNAENYFRFSFDLVKNHLETLSNNAERVRYLLEAKTDFEQQRAIDNWADSFVTFLSFGEKCELEIKKIADISRLEQAKDKTKAIEIPPRNRKIYGGSQSQTILAMYFLLDYIQAKGTVKDKGELVSFLTGFSAEKCRQLLPNPFEKANNDFPAFQKDLDEVKTRFAKLGLTELVKMIKNEADDIEKNL